MLLNIHRDIKITPDEVIEEFSKKHTRKLQLQYMNDYGSDKNRNDSTETKLKMEHETQIQHVSQITHEI
ncbi:52 kDa repressor of the inhibitor of the protein kinase-like [Aphis craccivora]|uniref:52 kDa repressor of the inhibitor of the protein kinase-like n=1 Tax=Aphis craccivora TaxID=307492 RepID=A0A6G0WEB4_APHCR|nr:52 kDa repressor of the inhibitor of the protein kinase-like [Aphis craccivora]